MAEGPIPDQVRRDLHRAEIKEDIHSFGNAIAAMWKVIMVLLVIALLSVAGHIYIREEVLTSRELDLQGRAVNCTVMLVDNDRTFSMPAQCLSDDVLPFYPQTVCPLLGDMPKCASKSDP